MQANLSNGLTNFNEAFTGAGVTFKLLKKLYKFDLKFVSIKQHIGKHKINLNCTIYHPEY